MAHEDYSGILYGWISLTLLHLMSCTVLIFHWKRKTHTKFSKCIILVYLYATQQKYKQSQWKTNN